MSSNLVAVKEIVTGILKDPDNEDALKLAPAGTQRAMAFIFSLLEAAASPESAFPLYLMWSKFPDQEEEYEFLSLKDAGILFDSGWKKVAFGNMVLESQLKLRPMTDEEKRRIEEIADEHSARK